MTYIQINLAIIYDNKNAELINNKILHKATNQNIEVSHHELTIPYLIPVE